MVENNKTFHDNMIRKEQSLRSVHFSHTANDNDR